MVNKVGLDRANDEALETFLAQCNKSMAGGHVAQNFKVHKPIN